MLCQVSRQSLYGQNTPSSAATSHIVSPPDISPIPSMTDPVGGGDFHPGQDRSVSRLLRVAKKKMQDSMLGGRYVSASSTRMKSLRFGFSRIGITLDQKEVNPNHETLVFVLTRLMTRLRFRSMR